MNGRQNWEYHLYIEQIKEEERKAKELHSLIVDISDEMNWSSVAPFTALSNSNLHTYALVKGLINATERELLRKYCE